MAKQLDLNVVDGSKPLQYIANDWFYMKTDPGNTCDPTLDNSDLCENNKGAVANLQTSTNNLGASITQYNDAKMLYNRELLFTFNILVGLAMLCYYIYLNQSAIPSPSAALNGVGEVGNMAGKLAMNPFPVTK